MDCYKKYQKIDFCKKKPDEKATWMWKNIDTRLAGLGRFDLWVAISIELFGNSIIEVQFYYMFYTFME